MKIKSLLENDSEHAKAMAKTGYWGAQGAGLIYMAISTKRFLLCKRSRLVEQPGTWGGWGGAIDPGEDPVQAAIREAEEETGVDADMVNIIPLYEFVDPGKFKYYNYLAIVEEEFDVDGNWEVGGFKWFEYGRWPQRLHPGLKLCLDDARSQMLMKRAISST
ncbi:hypothetical protein CL653_03565 [bacterium]|nr:hypothetical protein [bacterium]|tara:strand:+ start:1118 stop:1603 length:486 start_codon:yes stop_codon:yes gene_type:complete